MENSDKFWNIIDNADSFSVRGNSEKPEFGWAAQVNQAFAVELYLKSIMEFEKGEIKKGHNLKTLFKILKTKQKIQFIITGENIQARAFLIINKLRLGLTIICMRAAKYLKILGTFLRKLAA